MNTREKISLNMLFPLYLFRFSTSIGLILSTANIQEFKNAFQASIGTAVFVGQSEAAGSGQNHSVVHLA